MRAFVRCSRRRPITGQGEALRAAVVLCALLLALPSVAAGQAGGARSGETPGVGLEASGGVILPSGDLATFAEPYVSAGAALSVPVAPSVAIRVDAELDLLDRDVSEAPLIDIYSAIASLEYVARQREPGRVPLHTALRLGAGLSVVEAAEMPIGAPAGSEFNESYFTLTAGARLGYPLTSSLVAYLAPGVRWFRMPEEDARRLTEGLAVTPPENGWLVPVRAGFRLEF